MILIITDTVQNTFAVARDRGWPVVTAARGEFRGQNGERVFGVPTTPDALKGFAKGTKVVLGPNWARRPDVATINANFAFGTFVHFDATPAGPS